MQASELRLRVQIFLHAQALPTMLTQSAPCRTWFWAVDEHRLSQTFLHAVGNLFCTNTECAQGPRHSLPSIWIYCEHFLRTHFQSMHTSSNFRQWKPLVEFLHELPRWRCSCILSVHGVHLRRWHQWAFGVNAVLPRSYNASSASSSTKTSSM
jgi:hypothetical protein